MELLRVGPMAGRVVLAALLVVLLVRYRRYLPGVVAKCWAVILFAVGYAAVNGVWIETLAIGFADLATDAPRRLLYYPVYNAGYLINAALAAMLPAALLALLLKGGVAGRAALGAVYAGGLLALSGVLRGSHTHWDVLLSTAAPLQILGLAGWLAFFIAYFLGYLPRVDGYLAGFVAVTAVFVMLTPMNEVLFRAVGMSNAGAVWDPVLVMQLGRYLLQIPIVVALMLTLRRGGAVGRAPDPATGERAVA